MAEETTTSTTKWYEGQDPTLVGHITNKGWADRPVNEVAVEAIKAHINAEKLIGAPSDQVLRIPKADDEVAQNQFWQKLGFPATGKEGYDFSTIKGPDGAPLKTPTIDQVREIAGTLRLPQAAALRLAEELTKAEAGRLTADQAERTAKLADQKKALLDNWTPQNFEANMLVARAAAKAIGIDPEVVAALEGVIGYDKIMEAFRTLGTKLGEDKLIVPPNDPTKGGVMSKDQARARIEELKADDAFVKRYQAGGAPERREMDALHVIVAG